MNKTTILIADNEPSIRRLVRSALEDEEHREIYEASDGQEVLELLRTHAPEVLILDLMMPHRSGIEVLEELQHQPLLRRPRIIVLSAKADEEQHVLQLGAELFLSKPFSPLQLMELVDQISKPHPHPRDRNRAFKSTFLNAREQEEALERQRHYAVGPRKSYYPTK